ncbi:ABC transporter permease [Ancrocorticia sp.]|uniref:ABC transporter permease n=1 Tax=Ancrocorticia sp. TaxID=2593684 RepID=UPI003F8F5127
MGELLRANIRAHSRRYSATALAVAISMAFVVAALALASGMDASVTKSVRDQYAGVNTVVNIDYDSAEAGEHGLEEYTDTISGVDGVEAVNEQCYGYWDIRTQDGSISPSVNVARNQELISGKLPEGSAEVAMSQANAEALGVGVGGEVTATNGFGDSQARTLRVTGILESETVTTTASVIAAPDTMRAVDETYEPDALYVSGSGDLDSSIAAAIDDPGIQVRSADDAMAEDLEMMQMGQGTLTAFMLVFPIIALTVAAIVVATTFRIIFEQRRRELALLRTLGATSRQVRGMIRGETLLVGAVSSFIGVILGAVLGAFVLVLIDVADGIGEAFGMLNISQLLIVWIVGTLLTFLIGTRPAKSVTRVSPMEALIPIDSSATKHGHKVRVSIGAVIAAVSIAGLYFGISRGEDVGFLIAFASGVLGFIGALLVCSVLLPKVTYLFGAPFRSVVGIMARSNTVRNPERTGSTGTAIILGVTLITTMAVAAGSMRETLLSEVDSRRPYDLVTIGDDMPDSLIDRVAGTEGVANAIEVRGVDGTLDGNTLTINEDSSNGTNEDADGAAGSDAGTVDGATADDASSPITILAQPDLNPVAHSTVSVIGDGQAIVPSYLGIDSLNLCGSGQCVDLTVTQDDDTEDIRVSPTTLAQVSDSASVREIYVSLADDADATEVQNALTSIDNNIDVGGAAAERAMYTQIINSVLLVIVGLLAVSVLVALVGVANTLSLSVFERTRENGLLRTLGLTKKQMRRMLVLEATLIAGSSAIIGVGLGIFFGWVGTLALPFDVEHTVIVIPWLQVIGVVVIAVLAAIVASFVPGRKAAKVSPVEALAA